MDYKDPEKILEICKKADPGPWYATYDPRTLVATVENDDEIIVYCEFYRDTSPQELEKQLSDHHFIASAREALPYYVNRCLHLQAAVDAAIDAVCCGCPINCLTGLPDEFECIYVPIKQIWSNWREGSHETI